MRQSIRGAIVLSREQLEEKVSLDLRAEHTPLASTSLATPVCSPASEIEGLVIDSQVIVDQILEALIKDREQVSSPEVFERKCLVRRLKEGPTNKTR